MTSLEASRQHDAPADDGAARWRPLPAWLPASRLIHLVYLSNLVWQPVFDPTPGVTKWAIAGAVAVLFVPLYVAAYHPSRTVRETALIGTLVLGTAATSVNVGGSVLFVYAGVMAVYQYGRQAWRWLVGLSALMSLLAAVSFVPLPYRVLGILPSLGFLWIIGLSERHTAERERDAERLRVDNVRIEQLATAAERERIARDLHDLLGQSLTSLVVRAQLVQSLSRVDPGDAAAQAARLEESARDALRQLRTAVGGLSQISLTDEVDTAVRGLQAAGVQVVSDIPGHAAPSPLVERSLALALREATTNVIRHSRARNCRIVLSRDGKDWRLDVDDDGQGGVFAEGHGLRGMRERITAIGGQVRHSGSRTRGTRVTVTVPA